MSKSFYMRDKANGHIHRTNEPSFWLQRGDEQLTEKHGKGLYKKQHADRLVNHIKESGNPIIYTLCHSVSSSGMSRNISLFIVSNNRIEDITHQAAIITNSKLSKNRGLIVKGLGFSAGQHIVEHLQYELKIELKHSWV